MSKKKNWNEGERGRREMMAVGDLVKRSFFSFLLKKGRKRKSQGGTTAVEREKGCRSLGGRS